MRALAVLLSLLLVASVAAAAQDSRPRDDEDEPDERDEDRSGPGRDGSKSGDGEGEGSARNETEDGSDGEEGEEDGDSGEGDDEGSDDRRGSRHPKREGRLCERTAPGEDARAKCSAIHAFRGDDARFIHFDLDGQVIRNYRIGDLQVIDALRLLNDDGELEIERDGRHQLRIEGDDSQLRLHDNPTGLIRFKGEDGSQVVIDLPEGSRVEEGGMGLRITYESGHEAFLLADNASWNGTEVTLSEFFSFHVPVRDSIAVHDLPPAAPLDLEVQHAIEGLQVGARVTLRPAHQVPEGEAVLVEAYTDMDVEVDDLPGVASADDPIRVVVSSDDADGRTIVLDVDPALLESDDPQDMVMRYFDLHEDGSETEVLFRQAAGLEDVLDPADDGGQPEFWVVTDANGLQVLVSVPHWSAHAITMASVVEFVTQPSVLVGVVAGVGGSVLAAAVMLWPRRRDE